MLHVKRDSAIIQCGISVSSRTQRYITLLACVVPVLRRTSIESGWADIHFLPLTAPNIASSLLLRDIKMFFVPPSACCQVQDLHLRQWHQLSYPIMCRIIRGQAPTSSGRGFGPQKPHLVPIELQSSGMGETLSSQMESCEI